MKVCKENVCLNVDGNVQSVEDINLLVTELQKLSEKSDDVCYCDGNTITIPSSVVRELEKEAESGKRVIVKTSSDKTLHLLEMLDDSGRKLSFNFQKA